MRVFTTENDLFLREGSQTLRTNYFEGLSYKIESKDVRSMKILRKQKE